MKGTKELENDQKTINKRAIVHSYLSINTLNINGLNSIVKRYRVAAAREWQLRSRALHH